MRCHPRHRVGSARRSPKQTCAAARGRYALVCTLACTHSSVGLSAQDVQDVQELQKLISYAVGCIGQQYDLRNMLVLARYLIPTPPVLTRWRRCLLALGGGDPSGSICSTLITQAFQSLRYPILPNVARTDSTDTAS